MQIADELRVFTSVCGSHRCSVGDSHGLLGLRNARIENGVRFSLDVLCLFDLLKRYLSQLVEVRRNGGGASCWSQLYCPVIEQRREHHHKKANTHFHAEMMAYPAY